MKKISALILGSLMLFSAFTACDNNNAAVNEEEITFESVLEKSIETTKDYDSFAMDMTMDLGMVISEQSIDMTMDATSEFDGKSKTMFMSMTIDMMGQSVVTDTYVDLENYVMYLQAEDEWYKSVMDDTTKAQYESSGGQIDLSAYAEYMKDGTLKETEYNGIGCYELSGAVDYDIGEILKSMNLESILGTSGIDSSSFENVEPFVLVMGVDKETFLPVYCNTDMSAFMDSFMSATMSEAYAQQGLDVTIEIPVCNVTAEYRDYGNVTVVIPEEVLAAEELAM